MHIIHRVKQMLHPSEGRIIKMKILIMSDSHGRRDLVQKCIPHSHIFQSTVPHNSYTQTPCSQILWAWRRTMSWKPRYERFGMSYLLPIQDIPYLTTWDSTGIRQSDYWPDWNIFLNAPLYSYLFPFLGKQFKCKFNTLSTNRCLYIHIRNP